MRLAMIGLGRMGADIVRLIGGGHEVGVSIASRRRSTR